MELEQWNGGGNGERREKRGRQGKGERTRNGKGEEKVKKNPKLQCSHSPHYLALERATHSYQHNPHQAPPSKKVIQELGPCSLEGLMNRKCSLAVSTYVDTNPCHYFLFGKAATERQPHMAHQYIFWVNWFQTPPFILQEQGNKDPLPLTPT